LAKRQRPSRKGIRKHLADLGFTNRLAIYILLFLAAGLAGGFVLAWRSITYGYTGALACWSIVFTPIGTVAGIVLQKIVHKSEVENSSAEGDGIKYAIARAQGFAQDDGCEESPSI